MYKKLGLLAITILVLMALHSPAFAVEGNGLIMKWWDKNNVDEIKDMLQPSVYLRVKDWGLRIPETKYIPWEMPKAFKEATEKSSLNAKIDANGNLQGWIGGFPFPNPKTPEEIMWNFKRRYEGDDRWAYEECKLVSFKGPEKKFNVIFTRLNLLGRVTVPPMPEFPDNPNRNEFRLMIAITEPFELRGFGTLEWYYEDEGKESDFWMYIPSLRRVRRASAASRQDTWDGTEITIDDLNMFNAKIRENTYKMLPQKEWLVPAFMALRRNYDKRQPLDQTFERVPAYNIEAIPKDSDYIYSKRVLWVDPHSFMILGAEYYDKAGQLWKYQIFPFITHGPITDEVQENIKWHGNLDVPKQVDGWSCDFVLGHSTFYWYQDSWYDSQKLQLQDYEPAYLKKMGH